MDPPARSGTSYRPLATFLHTGAGDVLRRSEVTISTLGLEGLPGVIEGAPPPALPSRRAPVAQWIEQRFPKRVGKCRSGHRDCCSPLRSALTSCEATPFGHKKSGTAQCAPRNASEPSAEPLLARWLHRCERPAVAGELARDRDRDHGAPLTAPLERVPAGVQAARADNRFPPLNNPASSGPCCTSRGKRASSARRAALTSG
jgi:hypothetical protein